MTVIHELQAMLWLDTPRGLALAKFMVDRGPDSDIEWVTVLNETGQILSFDNADVIVCKNYTLGRRVGWADFKYAPAAGGGAAVRRKRPSPVETPDAPCS